MLTQFANSEISADLVHVDMDRIPGPSVSQALSRRMLLDHLTKGVRRFPNCDFTGVDLSGISLRGALDFLPAVKGWMAEAATRPGISGRREGARLNEGGLWPTAPLVRRGLGQRELAAAAAHRPPQ